MDRRKFLAASLASSAHLAVASRVSSEFIEALSQQASTAEDMPHALRESLRNDPFRPQFHLLPKHNWMNDPCAPRYFNGQYHMFFQYNPGAPVWGDMHWAHAISPDLIHWKQLPVALSPTPGGYDSAGCFTGSVLPGMEVPSILYTGVTKTSHELETIRGEGLREVQCLATSTDGELKTWKKLDKPVLDGPPPGLKVTGFRDPCPWKDGDAWFLGVGSGFSKVGGAVLLYRSSDGRNWEYLHPLAQGKWNSSGMSNPVGTGEMWECPDFFPLSGKHVLLYSTEGQVVWEVGTFDKPELLFRSETKGMLDHGHYYAMKSMVDEKGRRILWGWVQETRSASECLTSGWAGAMALPRVLTIGSDNRLRMDVPPEFSSLQHDAKDLHASRISQHSGDALAGMSFSNRSGEVFVKFKVREAACGLELRNGSDAKPLFAINYDGNEEKPSVLIRDKTLPLSPDGDGISTAQLWMDGSVIEVFLDGREAMTARDFTPTTGNIQVAWTGAADSLTELRVSDIKPISDDRLTG